MSAGSSSSAGFNADGTATTVTASATTNTKGAWAQLSAAVGFSVFGVVISLGSRSVNTDMLVDIGTGGAGSEQVVISNILLTGNTSGSGAKAFYFPLRIPNGTRVAARMQSATASATCDAGIGFYGSTFLGMPSFDLFTTYGALTATSTGTALGDPAAAGYGAWTQIVASTTSPHSWLMGVIGDKSITTRTASQKYVYQTGIGAAASEVAVLPEHRFTSTSTTFGLNCFSGLPIAVANGTRIAMRYGSSATTTLGAVGCVYAGMGSG